MKFDFFKGMLLDKEVYKAKTENDICIFTIDESSSPKRVRFFSKQDVSSVNFEPSEISEIKKYSEWSQNVIKRRLSTLQ